jgi:hypothetical protein
LERLPFLHLPDLAFCVNGLDFHFLCIFAVDLFVYRLQNYNFG